MKQIKTYNDPFKINDDQIDFYNKNGYLLLKNVWPKEDVDLIRLDMDNHANGHFTNKLDAHYHKNIKICIDVKKCDIEIQLVIGQYLSEVFHSIVNQITLMN